MRKFLNFLFLFAFTIGVCCNLMAADAPPQVTITKSFKNTTIRSVFQTVEKEANLKIAYNNSELNDTKLVTREFKQASPYTVIRSVIGKNYTLTKKGNVITIKPKPLVDSNPTNKTTQPTPSKTQTSAKPTLSAQTAAKPTTQTQTSSKTSTPPLASKPATSTSKTTTQPSTTTAQKGMITKKFTNTPLAKIFKYIENKSKKQIKYDPKQLDDKQPITRNYKNTPPLNAVKDAVGENYMVYEKKGIITIKQRKNKKKTTETPPTKSEKSTKTETKPKAADKPSQQNDSLANDSLSRKGHYIQATIGLGYGDNLIKFRNNPLTESSPGKTIGNFAALIQLQYAYYFHENWGVTAGLGFGNYFSTSKLNTTKRWNGQTDSEGDTYDHITTANNWKEREMLYMLDIPVGIQFQHPIASNGTAIYAGTGIRVGFPISSKYKLLKGDITHTGYYPATHATLHDTHDFYTESIGEDFNKNKHSIDLKPVSIAVMADFGFLFPLSQQIDFMLGAYFHITCNDMKDKKTDLGWQQPTAIEKHKQHDFMNTYEGVIASEFTKNTHPFQVGLKLGISWHKRNPKPAPEIKEEPIVEKQPEPEPEPAPKPKPKPEPKPVIVKVPEPKPEPEPEPETKATITIRKLASTSVIWFDLGSTNPKLQPPDIIDKIAEVLKENPNQKILINGHASKDGNEEYNRKLSERRAKAVYDLFIKAGVNPEQMKTQGLSILVDYKGKRDNSGKHDISLDRRVEIIPIK